MKQYRKAILSRSAVTQGFTACVLETGASYFPIPATTRFLLKESPREEMFIRGYN